MLGKNRKTTVPVGTVCDEQILRLHHMHCPGIQMDALTERPHVTCWNCMNVRTVYADERGLQER